MKIIFFGDSITDAERDRENPNDLGKGFVLFAANKLRLLYPEKELLILNKGIGGERTTELLQRIEKDVVAEKPDLVVLLAGINDVWRRMDGGEVTTEEQFRTNYKKLVETIQGTGAKLILIESFLLDVASKKNFRPYVDAFNKIIREIADGKIPLIPMDEIFRGLTQDISPEKFAADGVHPTHRGCRYIANLAVKEIKKFVV
ncbi:MAG: GDSL family lipase [Clostridia bacterium]|nr:GDSL family lipase [Clostridia bacterium]